MDFVARYDDASCSTDSAAGVGGLGLPPRPAARTPSPIPFSRRTSPLPTRAPSPMPTPRAWSGEAEYVELTFRMRVTELPPNHRLVVVGDGAALGDFQIERGVPCMRAVDAERGVYEAGPFRVPRRSLAPSVESDSEGEAGDFYTRPFGLVDGVSHYHRSGRCAVTARRRRDAAFVQRHRLLPCARCCPAPSPTPRWRTPSPVPSAPASTRASPTFGAPPSVSARWRAPSPASSEAASSGRPSPTFGAPAPRPRSPTVSFAPLLSTLSVA